MLLIIYHMYIQISSSVTKNRQFSIGTDLRKGKQIYDPEMESQQDLCESPRLLAGQLRKTDIWKLEREKRELEAGGAGCLRTAEKIRQVKR